MTIAEDNTSIDDSLMKYCPKCKENKPRNEFNIDKSQKDRLSRICKECNRKRNKAYYQKNKEQVLLKTKKYRQSNRKQVHQTNKIYRQNNKEKEQQRHKKYYQKNKEQILQKFNEYRQENPNKIKAQRTINNAIKSKKLKRPKNCTNCKREGIIEAHHPDYSKPLDIIWLCSPCHKRIHSNSTTSD